MSCGGGGPAVRDRRAIPQSAAQLPRLRPKPSVTVHLDYAPRIGPETLGRGARHRVRVARRYAGPATRVHPPIARVAGPPLESVGSVGCRGRGLNNASLCVCVPGQAKSSRPAQPPATGASGTPQLSGMPRQWSLRGSLHGLCASRGVSTGFDWPRHRRGRRGHELNQDEACRPVGVSDGNAPSPYGRARSPERN